jgi:hypothetical protein
MTSLWVERLMNRGSISVSVKKCSFLRVVQTGSGAHAASSEVSFWGSFPEDKRPGREDDHSLSSSAEVKRSGNTTPLRHTSSWSSA